MNNSEAIIEFTQLGNTMKVTAICPYTFIEATIVGSPSLSREFLSRQAIKKLQYVKDKK